MTVSANPSPPPLSPHDWMRGVAVWGLVPGWIASLILHAGLFSGCLLMTQMESCRGDYSGEEGAGFRAVGLRDRSSLDDPGGPGEGASEEQKATPQPASPAITPPPTTPVFDGPPVPLSLPTAEPRRPWLGTGPPALGSAFPTTAPPGSGQVTGGGIPGSRGQGSGSVTGSGAGQTSLFGVNDAGKKFVYVIDRSSSMEEFEAFAAAKSELLTSLSRLTEIQQFQIILYNSEPLMLETRDSGSKMFFGNDPQRLQVQEQIRSISPTGGTRHLPALELALKLNPDVIFLLTDGIESSLDAGEMESLKNRNRQGTRIHCIEFGRGPQVRSPNGQSTGNFLMKLAEQHSGKYTYRDMKTFAPGRTFETPRLDQVAP